jgi:hypothetical protein
MLPGPERGKAPGVANGARGGGPLGVGNGKRTCMISQTFVIVVGLGLAAWGHFLVHDVLGAAGAWTRVDNLFPPALRSSPSFAGALLLLMGGMLVLVPVLG